ncbi:MAG: hypothetical protein IPN71_16410 [Fibrobacteres bacterium]|nr:hypothetical protein [Fibrobacterota bacterium]
MSAHRMPLVLPVAASVAGPEQVLQIGSAVAAKGTVFGIEDAALRAPSVARLQAPSPDGGKRVAQFFHAAPTLRGTPRQGTGQDLAQRNGNGRIGRRSRRTQKHGAQQHAQGEHVVPDLRNQGLEVRRVKFRPA